MNEATAEFGYASWSKVWFWVDAVVESLFACAFFLIASFGIVTAPSPLLLAGAAAMYYPAGVCVSRVHLRLKHRHILGIGYVVSPRGISVQENERQELIEWAQVTKAEYLPIVPLYRMWASGLSKPVVLFAIGGAIPRNSTDRRRNTAWTLLREGLKAQLKTRWLPW